MPPIPRYPAPRIQGGTPTINLRDILAPQIETAKLAETAQEAITKPVLTLLDRQLEEERRTRQLAFQAEVAQDNAKIINDVNEHVMTLAQAGRSDEIHQFFSGGGIDNLINERVGRYVNKAEREQARTTFIETGSSLYSGAIKSATEANIRSALAGYENFQVDTLDAVRAGTLSVQDAQAKLGEIGSWAYSGNLISDERRVSDIDLFSKKASEYAVRGAIDRVQTLAADDTGKALRLLEQYRKTVPDQVVPEMKESAAADLANLKRGLEQQQENERGSVERQQLSGILDRIKEADKRNMPAAYESAMKDLRKFQESAVNPVQRERADTAALLFGGTDKQRQIESDYQDHLRGMEAVNGRQVTFTNPAQGVKALDSAVRQKFEDAGPAGSDPGYRLQVASDAVLNNTNGIIPPVFNETLGQLADAASTNPDAMAQLVANMDRLRTESPTTLTDIQATRDGKRSYAAARTYRDALARNREALLAKANVAAWAQTQDFKDQIESQARQMATAEAQAVLTAPERGKDYKTLEDTRRATANAPDWKDGYTKRLKTYWLFSNDTAEIIQNATGMNRDEYNRFITTESQNGVNAIVHEELFNATKDFYVRETPLNTKDSDALDMAFELAAGKVFNTWKWTPNGFTKNTAAAGTPTIKAAKEKAAFLADFAITDGKLDPAERQRVIDQDGYQIIGNNEVGYTILERGVLPVWRASADDIGKRVRK